MKVVYIGNFGPEHSTENHLRRALQSLDVEVVPVQEDKQLDWLSLPVKGADFLLWTRTGSLDTDDKQTQRRALEMMDIPTVGYHLDRWWGLTRQPQISTVPFFNVDLLCTADGGHEQEWLAAGVNHSWYPPAVLAEEAQLGEPDPEYRCEVAFVGQLTNYGHPEWGPYRRQLARFLTYRYKRRFRVFPGQGQPGIRGKQLQDLYASVKVVVGDSCLAGGIARYWSDRIPETCGRGAFLLHPYVVGLETEHPDLVTYPLDLLGTTPDFSELGRLIDFYLREDTTRSQMARLNREHVLEYHTYQHRMVRLLAEVKGL